MTSLSSWQPLSAPPSSTWGAWVTLAGMERLGASVADLAKEMYESIMGYEGEGGHKPPRADIQKMKEVYDLYARANHTTEKTPDGQLRFRGEPSDQAAKDKAMGEWQAKYMISPSEQKILREYDGFLNTSKNPTVAFNEAVKLFSSEEIKGLAQGLNTEDYYTLPNARSEEEVKRYLGQALKRREESGYHKTYEGIEALLKSLIQRHPESYKLWPWAVKQVKENYRPGTGSLNHIGDIVGEGGKLLDQLRRENKTPQNMDVNKMSFREFEDWLMQWKRDNREQEAQGEVVYKFHDDWTIQRLTTPEQLQYEGDEMGHCVGGYDQAAASGESVIYSLRDPKGAPHVTMEVEGLEGEPDAMGYQEYHAPHSADPEASDAEDKGLWDGVRGKPYPFQVVQVQGKGNKAPIGEYQRKIKEFMDSLRAKGVNFERSENWYDNWGGNDDDDPDDWEGTSVNTAGYLQGWYDYYQSQPGRFQGRNEDAYGMKQERRIQSADMTDTIIECCASLIDDYDRDRVKTSNWKLLAQATYHLYSCQEYMSDEMPASQFKDDERVKRYQEQFERELDKAQEKVDEWTRNDADYAIPPDMIIEKYEEKGGEMDPEDDNEPLDQELYDEASMEIQKEHQEQYAGNASRYLGYLYNLLYHKGFTPATHLPDPNQSHGGLPSYDELIGKNQQAIAVPGAMSAWKPVKPALA